MKKLILCPSCGGDKKIVITDNSCGPGRMILTGKYNVLPDKAIEIYLTLYCCEACGNIYACNAEYGIGMED